jgi:hypothetical protein
VDPWLPGAGAETARLGGAEGDRRTPGAGSAKKDGFRSRLGIGRLWHGQGTSHKRWDCETSHVTHGRCTHTAVGAVRRPEPWASHARLSRRSRIAAPRRDNRKPGSKAGRSDESDSRNAMAIVEGHESGERAVGRRRRLLRLEGATAGDRYDATALQAKEPRFQDGLHHRRLPPSEHAPAVARTDDCFHLLTAGRRVLSLFGDNPIAAAARAGCV